MGDRNGDGVAECAVMMDKEKTGSQKHKESKLKKCLKERSFLVMNICGLSYVLIALTIMALIIAVSHCVKGSTSLSQKDEEKQNIMDPCEDDWIWYRGKCYYFSTEPDTWRNSEKFCHLHESSLAIIDDQEELDFLFRFKGLDNHWIGLRRTDDDTAWTWTNGESYNESLFQINRLENFVKEENVYLNDDRVNSGSGAKEFKFVCNMSSKK